MSRVFNLNVFNDVIVGTTAVVTDPKYDEVLGSADALAVQCIADQVPSTGSPTITVGIEHSGDRKNWIAKTTAIGVTGLGSTSTNVLSGNDPGTTPMLGFVRLKITLGGTTPSARVQLFACGRSN